MLRRSEGRTGSMLLSVSLAVFGPMAVGCGGGEETAEEAAPAPEAAAPAAPAGPTDAEIAHIVVTANTIDAEMGQLAQTKAQSEAVRRFAQTMVTDHNAVNAQAQQLATQLNVTPVEHQVSRDLRQSADAARMRLDSLTGGEFDRAYIQREVEYHQAVLSALDNTLIPSAQNAQLKTLLEQTRPAIDAHLQEARRIQGTL